MMGCADKLVVPGTTCRSIQLAWLAVMFVEHDRECPSPRCRRGNEIGKALKCCAVVEDDSAAVGAPRARCVAFRLGCVRIANTGDVRADAVNDGVVFRLIDGRG